MSEPTRVDGGEPPASGAGAILRAARQKQGLHIAALATSIKVTPAKLEALEAGRYDELPDATFVRALAQSVCRALKIDAQPVLAQLPSNAPVALDKVDNGLNTPFRERPGRVVPAEWLSSRQPALWLALLLLAAAAAFVMLPGHWLSRLMPATDGDSVVREEVGGARPAVAPSSTTVVEAPNAAQPGATPDAAASGAAAPTTATATGLPPAPGPLAVTPAGAAGPATPAASVAAANVPTPATAASASRVHALEPSWVQVVDARGQVLLARTLQAGESVELAGARPLKLRIGNVRGTELMDRGQPIELASRTRDNVVNVELP